jgi:hypothetical protein
MNGSPTPLLDRIEKKHRQPVSGGVVIPFRRERKPVWIQRMQVNGLPPKDMSEWTPEDAA